MTPRSTCRRGGRGVCRGVSFFRAPAGAAECPTRLLMGTVDNKLIALDAKTGETCRGFGKDGSVDLSEGEGLEPATRGWINPTSPPAIVHGTAVIGSLHHRQCRPPACRRASFAAMTR